MASKEHLSRFITHTSKLLIVGAAVYEISRFAFPTKARTEIRQRDDGTCQCLGCQEKNVNAHHIVPQSCLKQSLGDFHDHLHGGSGYYVENLNQYFHQLIQPLNGHVNGFMDEWKLFIQSPANGITLCTNHHRLLHRNDPDLSSILLSEHPQHPTRPQSLDPHLVHNFLQHHFSSVLQSSSSQ